MSNGTQGLTLLVGEMRGELRQHMQNAERDRDQREVDRVESAEYRKEVRHTLRNLTMSVAAIPPLDLRVKAVETTAEDYRTLRIRIGVAIFIVGGSISLIFNGLMWFASDIKMFLMRLFRIG